MDAPKSITGAHGTSYRLMAETESYAAYEAKGASSTAQALEEFEALRKQGLALCSSMRLGALGGVSVVIFEKRSAA